MVERRAIDENEDPVCGMTVDPVQARATRGSQRELGSCLREPAHVKLDRFLTLASSPPEMQQPPLAMVPDNPGRMDGATT